MLKGNLHNLFTVLLAVCDTKVKNNIKAFPSFKEMDKKLDYMAPGRDNQHAKHNKPIAQIIFMGLYQEKCQNIKEFRDLYVALHKMCTELALRSGRCKEDVKAMLVKEAVTYPIMEQLIKAVDLVEEEHHAIVFLYKVDKQKYGKLPEETENDILQNKEPFPKTVCDLCPVLAR